MYVLKYYVGIGCSGIIPLRFKKVELMTLNKVLLGRQPKHGDVFFTFLIFVLLILQFASFLILFLVYFILLDIILFSSF